MSVRASVIIRSKDEADRLRLTLTSLACQSEPPEVVVVNDGSAANAQPFRLLLAAKKTGVDNAITVTNSLAADNSGASMSSNFGSRAL